MLEKIGEGGMGTVWKAEHELTGRIVAAKVLSPRLAADEEYVRRFLREARAAAALEHRNLTTVIHAGECEGVHYLLMEFIEGKTVHDIVTEEGPMHYETALAVVRQAAEGLSHAHARGIIHRDIKPENLMLSADAVVKITDMGLAKRASGDPAESSITLAGTILGTPRYMSPEQIQLPETVDLRTDIWSLGVTLYFMLTGATPFEGGSTADVLHRVVKSPISFPPRLPQVLVRLLRKMLARDRNRRFQNCGELIEALDGTVRELGRRQLALSGRRAMTVKSTTTDVVKARRSALLPLAAAGVGVLALGVLLVFVLSGRRAPPRRSGPDRAVDRAAAALKTALEYSREHPDDWSGAVAALRGVEARHPRLRDAVRAEIERVRARAAAALESACSAAEDALESGGGERALEPLAALRERLVFDRELSGRLSKRLAELRRDAARRAEAALLARARPVFFAGFDTPVVERNCVVETSDGRHRREGGRYALVLEAGGSVTLRFALRRFELVALRVRTTGGPEIVLQVDGNALTTKAEEATPIGGSLSGGPEHEVTVRSPTGRAFVERIEILVAGGPEPAEAAPGADDFATTAAAAAERLTKGDVKGAARRLRAAAAETSAKRAAEALRRGAEALERLDDFLDGLRDRVLRHLREAERGRLWLKDGRILEGAAELRGPTLEVGGEAVSIVSIHPDWLRKRNLLDGPPETVSILSALLGNGRVSSEADADPFIAALIAALREAVPPAVNPFHLGRYAVVITGPGSNPVQSYYYLNDNVALGRMLRGRGYPPCAVWRLSERGSVQDPGIDGIASLKNMRRLFDFLAAHTRPGDTLTIFIVGCGRDRVMTADGFLTGDALAEMVKRIECRMVFVLHFPGSGAFLPHLSGPSRIVLASNRKGEPGSAGWIGALRAALERGEKSVSFKEAFRAAARATADHYKAAGRPQAEFPQISGAALASRTYLGPSGLPLQVSPETLRAEGAAAALFLDGWLSTGDAAVWEALAHLLKRSGDVCGFAEAAVQAARAGCADLSTLARGAEALLHARRTRDALRLSAPFDRMPLFSVSALGRVVHVLASLAEGRAIETATLERLAGSAAVTGRPRFRLVLAAALARAGRKERAERLAEGAAKALKKDYVRRRAAPQRVATLLKAAERALRRGDASALARDAWSALAAAPTDGRAWAYVALAESGSKKALSAAWAALAFSPRSPLSSLALAHALVSKDPAAANCWLQHALAQSPPPAVAAAAKRMQKGPLEAARVRRAQEVERALSRAKAMDAVAAAELVRRHLTLSRPETFLALADILRRSGCYCEAARAYALCIAAVPSPPTVAEDPAFALGGLLVRLKQPREALKVLIEGEKRFVSRTGRPSAAWWFAIAGAYKAAGDEERAKEAAERAGAIIGR